MCQNLAVTDQFASVTLIGQRKYCVEEKPFFALLHFIYGCVVCVTVGRTNIKFPALTMRGVPKDNDEADQARFEPEISLTCTAGPCWQGT